jgi:hypothetical protein
MCRLDPSLRLLELLQWVIIPACSAGRHVEQGYVLVGNRNNNSGFLVPATVPVRESDLLRTADNLNSDRPDCEFRSLQGPPDAPWKETAKADREPQTA